jgi:hypothetical protein
MYKLANLKYFLCTYVKEKCFQVYMENGCVACDVEHCQTSPITTSQGEAA